MRDAPTGTGLQEPVQVWDGGRTDSQRDAQKGDHDYDDYYDDEDYEDYDDT